MKHGIISIVVFIAFSLSPILFCGCEKASVIDNGEIVNNNPVIREKSVSADGRHQIATLVTRSQGIGVEIDGTGRGFDDFSIRFCPVIDNAGHYAWILETKGRGYEIMWMDKSILLSAASFDHLTASDTKALAVQSDIGKSTTRLYLIDMSNGDCNCIHKWQMEYIEAICRFGKDMFGVLTCRFDNEGNKLYFLYRVDGNTSAVEPIEEGVSNLMEFPVDATSPASVRLKVDIIKINDNIRYLYNALKLYGGGKDAFAYGNDFRGRMAWDESQRLRGLCELYKKTNNDRILQRINEVVSSIMNGRNSYVGIIEDDWNPAFLWSSKCYSIGGAPICTVVENCEILSALLYACNEGFVTKENKVIAAAKDAYNFFDQWYKAGHYYLPKGMPSLTDGLLVPWNHQNSMAEVALGLYIETGDQKYLTRCEELITTFKTEWVKESDRIYWHYWPEDIYKGWPDDGRSVNQPTAAANEDKLYEDASHAGISVRMLSRYVDVVPNGAVGTEDMKKIESNMKYFCFRDGFSRFISGDLEYNPKAWHYWISPYFSYLHNYNFEKYVRQGYLRCFPLWDSQGALFANAKLYRGESSGDAISIERYEMEDSYRLKAVDKFEMTESDLYDYLGIN